jgi:hypothetical protein
MRIYHPESWSQQAREMCDRQVRSINSGWSTIKHAVFFFGHSYRNSLITTRAAKRFGRMVRAGKVHENEELFRQHFPDNYNIFEF